MDDQTYDFKTPRKRFSKIGIAFSVLVLSAVLGSFLIALIPKLIWGSAVLFAAAPPSGVQTPKAEPDRR